jgi:stearoyl-CoA desaturase (delta-9 desaturase)
MRRPTMRISIAPGEWDPGWQVLRAFEKLGLASNLRMPRAEFKRDDLEVIVVESRSQVF